MTTLFCQAKVMMLQGHSRNTIPKASPLAGNDQSSLSSPPSEEDHDAEPSSFNLFASVPPVPWEADRRYSFALDRRIPTRNAIRNSSARRVPESHRSKSWPPWPSFKDQKSSRSKLDSQVGRGVNGFSEMVEKQVPWCKDMENPDDHRVLVQSRKFGTQNVSEEIHSGPQMPGGKEIVEFDWSDSDAEKDDEDHVSRKLPEPEHDVPIELIAPSASTTSSSAIGSIIPPVKASSGASEGNGDQSGHKIPSWHTHNYPDLPFDFQFSYSETPKVPILQYREPAYSPFGPRSMKKPWLGLKPPKPSKRKVPPFDSFNPPPPQGLKGVKHVQPPGPFPEGQGPKAAKTREEIMGDPLTREEIVYLVEKCNRESRQINLGRDGLTHNMLDSIHCHWKRRRVCKIKCKGVPTVDMDNVKIHVEEKTGGRIIYQTGGVLYLFRGRNYNYKNRPFIPLMLWKPAPPVYPKLIQTVPEGLTEEEVINLRKLGKKVEPICKLTKNGFYLDLVKNVRAAFKIDNLVRIDCRGLKPSDYKRIAAKLKDLVPCVLLSFYKDHILMWKGNPDGLTTVAQADTEALDSSAQEAASTPASIEVDGMTLEETKDMVRSKLENTVGGQIMLGQERGIDGELNNTSWEQSKSQRLDVKEERMQDVSSHLSVNERESNYDIFFDGWSQGQVIHEEVVPVNKNEELVPMAALSSDLCVNGVGSNLNASIKVDRVEQGDEQVVSGGSDGEVVAVSPEISVREAGSNLDTSTDVMTIEQVVDDEKVLPQHADEEAALMEAVSSNASVNESDSNLYVFIDEQVMDQMHDEITTDEAEHGGCVDERWNHALSSGMALEVNWADMDSDVIVRRAALLAQACPIGPTYTHRLTRKWPRRKDVKLTVDEDISRHLNRVSNVKKPKKVVKRRPPLPTIDVPGMGGLPIDSVATLLATK